MKVDQPYHFLAEASFDLRVLSLLLTVCVRPSVRPSVRHQDCPCDNLWLVQARITKCWPEGQNNLVWVCIISGAIDVDLQGQIKLQNQILPNSEFKVCTFYNLSPNSNLATGANIQPLE